MTKSRAFRIGKAFGKKGVLGKASLETPESVGVTETADSAGTLGAADAGVSKFSTNDKKLFVYNGTAWDKILSGTDGPPVWDSGGSVVTVPKALSQNYNFNTNLATLDSQRVTLSVNAADPDGFPITYSSDQHPATNNLIDSVSQTSPGVFRVTPNIMSGESNANDTVSFRILASDGARVATGSTVFSISYSKFTIYKKGAASNGWWGSTYGTNYNYGADGQSGIGGEITDDGTTKILNKFGEYWLLPSTNFTADLKMWGAAGSTISDGVAGAGDDYDHANNYDNYSGFGGYTYARMSFVKDQYYTIIVGQGGAFGSGNGNSHGPPGTFGGGGAAGRANTAGHQHGRGSGGGLTGIFLGKEFSDVNAVHSASLLIAGGGGGGYGRIGGGGSGGGTTGTGSGASRGGGGASQSAGGAAGGGTYGSGTKQAGGKILGGTTVRTNVYTGGGGGGGYYGGGTGGPNNYGGGPGGGGSGYVKSDASITNSGMNTALAYNVPGPSPGRDEPEWGDRAGVGHADGGYLSNQNWYTGGGNPETDIGGWTRVDPGRFAIIPVN